jgi:hypothetical protein
VSVNWGNPLEHTEAFKRAWSEYQEANPEDLRPFYELDSAPRTAVLARQLEIYRELVS